LTILWIITSVVLFAAPYGWADVTVPTGELWNIPSIEHPNPEIGNVLVYGTLNLLPDAQIPGELRALPGSTVNIYGGQLGIWLGIYVSTNPTQIPDPDVTVYGNQFQIGIGDPFIPPSDPIIGFDTLYVQSVSGNFSFLVVSDIPIHLRAPGVEPPENEPPVANAGPDLTVFTKDIASTVIDGTATDLDEGDVLQYRWFVDGVATDQANVGANGEAPLDLGTVDPAFLDVGTHILTLEVTDDKEPVSDEMVLKIVNYIDIDIKPGSYPNTINLGSNGVVPVAILSTADFDATDSDLVNPDNVFLAGAGVAVRGKGNKYLASEEDVDGDGLMDLIVKVETENLDPGTFQDGGAFLKIFDTTDPENPILVYEGWDEITIVPPE